MRGDALFGDAVHVLGADLDFELVAAFGDERGVQRLVEVGPRHGDEVFEAAGHGTPDAVQQAEDGVAVGLGFGDDANGEEVVDLLDGDVVRDELLLDGEEALDAGLDAGRYADFVRAGSSRVVTMRCEEGFAFAAEGVDFGGELRVGEGIDVAEGEVFELAAQFTHAETMRERSVDVEGLAGDAALLLGVQVLERAHVVQAVGELDDDDAQVGDHGEQHLADVLGLVVFAVGELDLVELGDAFDDVGDLFAEASGDLGGGDVGVFDGVVQQAGGDGGGVHLELGEDLRDFQGMADVGLTRGAALALVLLDGKGPGGADEVEVVGGPVGLDGLDEVLEPCIKIGVFHRWSGSDGWRLGGGRRELAGGFIQRVERSGHTRAVRNGGERCFELHAGFAGLGRAGGSGRVRFWSAGDRCLRPHKFHTLLYGPHARLS